MIRQLLIGSLVIAVTVFLQAELFRIFADRFETILVRLRPLLHRYANTGSLILAVMFVLGVQSICVWIWATVFFAAGAVPTIETGLYFALTCYTTLGFGDITLTPDWRLLSGLTAANGFLNFGWSTAYMVELVRRTA